MPDRKQIPAPREYPEPSVPSVGEVLEREDVAKLVREGCPAQWEELADTTLLSPSWVTHHCYNLIRHAETHAGLIHRAELESVLSLDRGGVKGEPDQARHLYLMRLMERFEAAYPLGDDWPPEQWLVPLALPDIQPAGVETYGKLRPAKAVRLRYTYPGVPPGLIAQFIVRTHPLVIEGKSWARGTILALRGAKALVRAVSKTVVEVTAVEEPAWQDEDNELTARRDLAGLCRENLLTLHRQTGGMEVQETTEVEADGEAVWISVKTLEKDEEKGRKETAVETKKGSAMVETGKELDEFGTREGRLPEKEAAGLDRGKKGPLDARRSDAKPRIFISCSLMDERLRKTLELYLQVLKIQGLLHHVWHDRMIPAGVDWDLEIARDLTEAHVVLLLVSTAFLASDYIQTEELRPALVRHLAGKVRIIPILLENCDWVNTFAAVSPLCDLPEAKRRVIQCIPRDGKTIRSFSPQTDGWHVVQVELANVLSVVKAGLKQLDFPKSSPPVA